MAENEINNSIGQFSNQIDFSSDELIQQEENNLKQIKINFDRFSKRKQEVTGKFSYYKIWLESKLESKKATLFIFLTYLGIYGLFIAGSILFFIYNTYFLRQNHFSIASYTNLAKAANVFEIIILCIIAIPLLILLISWFVGINGVYKSVKFHLITQFIFVTILIFFIICVIFSAIYLNEYLSFNPPKIE